MRHRDSIISKLKSKYWRTSHKFGIQFPKTVKEAYTIESKLWNDFWTKAIAIETTNVRISSEKLDGVTPDNMRKGKTNPRYEHVNVHILFDINMDGKFTRKVIFVTNSHTTAPPSSIAYSSVLYRESVRIAFLLSSLNELCIFACDLGNAYLYSKLI